MENTCGNTAEGHAVHPVLCSQAETGAVAVRKKFLILFRGQTLQTGPHRVQDIPAGQIVGWRNFSSAHRFLMALLPHDVIHPETQLNTRVRVDYVIDAAMARVKAAEHLRVGGIDDGAAGQCRDVTLPDPDALPYRSERMVVGDTLFCRRLFQIGVLHIQEFLRYRRRGANVKESAQKPFLSENAFGDRELFVFLFLTEQTFQKIHAPFVLGHGRPPSRLRLRLLEDPVLWNDGIPFGRVKASGEKLSVTCRSQPSAASAA